MRRALMGLFEIPPVPELEIEPREHVQVEYKVIWKKEYFFLAMRGGVRLDETFPSLFFFPKRLGNFANAAEVI